MTTKTMDLSKTTIINQRAKEMLGACEPITFQRGRGYFMGTEHLGRSELEAMMKLKEIAETPVEKALKLAVAVERAILGPYRDLPLAERPTVRGVGMDEFGLWLRFDWQGQPMSQNEIETLTGKPTKIAKNDWVMIDVGSGE